MYEEVLSSTSQFVVMVSTPYYRGRNREYQVLRKLRDEGWLCSRSAASHGPVDVFAAKGGNVLLIQVKSGKGRLTQEDKGILRVWAQAYHGRAEAWFFNKRSKKRLLIYDGTKPSKEADNESEISLPI